MAGTSRSGRRPTPTALKLAKGSRLKPHDRTAPKYDAGAPEMPPHIAADPEARAVWQSLVGRLAQVGVLTVAHAEALTMLCDAWADYRRCREQFARMNYQQLVVDEFIDAENVKRRKIKPNPLIARSEKLALLINRLLGEFGLTPLSAGKVAAGQAHGDDPFARFLGA